ncbi:MAG: hypothetical protein PHW92_02985 [Lutibacter sp.]|nr:hypothetical protein [Lutibacter sp.]
MIIIKNIKKPVYTFIRVFLVCLFLIQPVVAQEISWFSNMPPKGEKKIVTNGMHRLSSIKGKRGQSSIIQWLRIGTNLENAAYIQIPDSEDFDFQLFSPSKKQVEEKLITKGGKSFFSYANKEEGYYNAYLTHKEVLGDTLNITVAKSEMLNHSCRNGHKLVRGIVGPHIYPEIIPVEIKRKRIFAEDLHYFTTSSDEVEYQFLVNGKPAEGASLTLVTQKNWNKTLKTNKEGKTTFQFIQDYFSSWQELKNREIYYYLLYGEIIVPEQGIYKGSAYSYVHYTTSLSDGYRPAKTMYMSMFWAFVVFILATIITVVGIFIYRLRRQKNYKEIKLDETSHNKF